jgi:AcrR family transcriptional regulator
MTRSPHPTKERLISVTMSMMDGDRPDKVHIDEVLLESGISKGSLYHHFNDFSELIEAALIRRFSTLVDASIGLIEKVVHDSKSKEEFISGLRLVTRATQNPDLSANRFERARALGMAGSNLRFRSALAVEQDRLTSSLEDLFRESQNRGWLSTQFNPHAGAVMIQAYTLGQVINDVSETKYNNDDWVALIDLILDKVFS